VHTLNGTGTSLNRLWIAIVENFQQKDGTIKFPKILQPYFVKEKDKIRKKKQSDKIIKKSKKKIK
jgi:seryl-tRNA synthetase